MVPSKVVVGQVVPMQRLEVDIADRLEGIVTDRERMEMAEAVHLLQILCLFLCCEATSALLDSAFGEETESGASLHSCLDLVGHAVRTDTGSNCL